MRLGRYCVVVLLACLLLQSCSSMRHQRIAEELQLGRVIYQTGDYRAAMRQLLPLAVECNAEAQYAVGYMYYYGYGVAADSEVGLFWIAESAKQGYMPAIKALKLAKERPVKKPPVVTKKVKDLPKKKIIVEPANADEQVASVAPAIVSATLSPEKKENKYTLQLLGSHELDTVKAYQAKLNLPEVKLGQTTHNGKEWYVLTYGNYSANYLAQLAKDELPQKVKSLNPWVRKTAGLTWISPTEKILA